MSEKFNMAPYPSTLSTYWGLLSLLYICTPTNDMTSLNGILALRWRGVHSQGHGNGAAITHL